MVGRLDFSPVLSALADFEHQLVLEFVQEQLDDLPFIRVSHEPGMSLDSYTQELPDVLREIWSRHNQGNPPPILIRSERRMELFNVFLSPSAQGVILDLSVSRGEHGFAYMVGSLRKLAFVKDESDAYRCLLSILQAITQFEQWDRHARGLRENINFVQVSVDKFLAEDLNYHVPIDRISAESGAVVLSKREVR